jgi:hypothetical protein
MRRLFALRVVILCGAKRPEEAGDARQAQPDRDRDQDRQHIHGDLRTALIVTLSEDGDIARAASSGEASPASATGIAPQL